jgi:fructokinase
LIAVVGESLIDLVVAPDGAITATPGGAPFNVARASARLGMPVSLITAVSTDRFGQRLTADLAADGVDDAYVQRSEQPTTLALADVDPSGGASYRFYLDGTSAPTLSATELPAGTRALVAGGLGVAVEPMASAVERMAVGSGDGVLVLVDVNCRPAAIADRDRYLERLDRVLGRADVIKVSVEDLGYVDPKNPAATVAHRLLDPASPQPGRRPPTQPGALPRRRHQATLRPRHPCPPSRRRQDRKREAIRCIKRFLARRAWRLLEHPPITA